MPVYGAPKGPAPKAAKSPSWGPLKSGDVAAQRRANPLAKPLSKTFAPLPGVGKPSKLGNRAAQERGSTSHPLFGGPVGAVTSGLGINPSVGNTPHHEREQAERLAHLKIGVAVPPLPGVNALVGAAAAGKALQAATGNASNKTLPGRLYNEALQTTIGGPRAAVEAVSNPAGTAKGVLHSLEHPAEHPIQTALILGGVARGADVAAGKALRTSTERAPGVVGTGEHVTEVPRRYSQGVVGKGAQKAVEKAKEGVGINPAQLRSKGLPIFGSKLSKAVIGGHVKSGAVDLARGDTHIASDMQTAKASEFVENNRPSRVLGMNPKHGGKVHDEAAMPYVEGYARRPETYWEDISKREGRLQAERKGLTNPVALERNAKQLEQLRLIKAQQGKWKTTEVHEQSARALTNAQSHSFHREVLEGHLEPDQYHARLIPFGLEHGELLGRGQLHYVKDTKAHPITAEAGKLKRELIRAETRTESAARDLARAEGRTAGVKATAPAGLKAGYKVATHWQAALHEARAEEMDLRRQVKDAEAERAHKINTGQIQRNGKQWPGLYDEHGQRVSGKELAELYHRETKGREPGFITHRDTEVPVERYAAKASTGALPGAVTRSRTGEHFLEGNYENHFGVMHREFRKSARNLASYRGRNQLLEQFGINENQLPESKGVRGVDEHRMIDLAHRLNSDPKTAKQRRELGDWVVVSRGPERVLTAPAEKGSRYSLVSQMGAAEGKAVSESMHEKPQRFTMIPEKVLQRIDDHIAAEKPTSPTIQALRRVTSYQRHNALYSSPRWPIGLHQENMIRLAAINTSPLVALGKHLTETSRAYKVGKGFYEGTIKAAGDDLRKIQGDPGYNTVEKTYARNHAAMLEHGSMIGSEVHDMMGGHSGISQDLLDKAASWPDRIAKAPGAKQGLAAWTKWKEFLGRRISTMETDVRTAAAGHLIIKQYGTFSKEVKGLLKQQDQIVQQVVHGKLNQVEAARFSQDLLDAMGNWSHLTPLTREMRSTFAPFSLWWLNSVKFMFQTMPLDHPLKTALWAALVAGTKPDERPEFKQGSIHATFPLVGDVDYSLIHYSPSDIGHEPVKTAESMVLPWFIEAFQRAAGVNPLYDESIYNRAESEGKGPQNVKAAAENTGLTFVPFSSAATSVIRQGGAPNTRGPFPAFEAKKGTEKGYGKAALKYLAPVPFTFGEKKKKASGAEQVAPERVAPEWIAPEKVTPEKP